MNIELKFDYYSKNIYIPDGYVHNLRELQNSFFDWIQSQPDCIVKAPGNQYGLSYNEEDFLKYVNSVILKDYKEKAYFVTERRNCHTLEF